MPDGMTRSSGCSIAPQHASSGDYLIAIRWNTGLSVSVTLLGDAAHPMLPFMGQGAAMAIEDGLALALLLADDTDPPDVTLRRYEALRLSRTRRVQLGSRGRAAENHLRSPTARLRRDIGFLISAVVQAARNAAPGRMDI